MMSKKDILKTESTWQWYSKEKEWVVKIKVVHVVKIYVV